MLFVVKVLTNEDLLIKLHMDMQVYHLDLYDAWC